MNRERSPIHDPLLGSRGWLILLALTTLLFVACDDSSPTAPQNQDPEEVATVTETFSGMLNLGDRIDHGFVTVAFGSTRMTVTALAPLATLTVGLGIGTIDAENQTCTIFAQDTTVRVGETLRADGLSPGSYCARIFDVGNIFEDVTVEYTLEVEHP